MKSRDILIWLSNLRGVNNRYLEFLDLAYPDLGELWDMTCDQVYAIQGIGSRLKQSIVESRCKAYYESILESAEKKGVDIVTIRDQAYPENLLNIPDAPRVLYLRGRLFGSDKIAISIVGARKATPYGIWATEKLCRELSYHGLTIVSGMALGIDASAHMEAIKSGGRTIAVLGTGVDVLYPSRNRHIYEAIIENGAVLSEFPIGTGPLPYRFPQRNRIVSGLSLGTVVVEAGERSGTLITVGHALDQGRDVFAVPGNIGSDLSRGTNNLIREGAKLVQSAEDIVEEISSIKSQLASSEDRYKLERPDLSKVDLSPLEKEVLFQLTGYPKSPDEIAVALNKGVSEVLSLLTILEIKGLVEKLRDKRYSCKI